MKTGKDPSERRRTREAKLKQSHKPKGKRDPFDTDPLPEIAAMITSSPAEALYFCVSVRKLCDTNPPSDRAIAQCLTKHPETRGDPKAVLDILRPRLPDPPWEPGYTPPVTRRRYGTSDDRGDWTDD